MVVQEASINNIMGGLEGAEGVKLHTHRRKLKQRFDIIKKLGQGTYGKVQLGINKETGQEVAIKTIKKAKIETEGDLIRIRREIQIMSSLRHPYIIHIYEVFENKDKIVLVMEYSSGGELYDYLSQRKVLDDVDARRIFRQIAMAVYYCHKHQICHRDLKLENILLDEDGNAKLADFGLSNVFDASRLLSTFCGSPLYASPEIVSGIPYYGPEVDCWSLGVLLYTLVYGAMPFDGSNFKRLVKQISHGEYYEPKTPSSASGLIRALLTVDGSERLDIVGVCSHSWLNSDEETPCVKRALELSAEKPVRLDLLLSLNQPRNQAVTQAGAKAAVVKSHSLGSVPSSTQTSPINKPQVETKIKDDAISNEIPTEVLTNDVVVPENVEKLRKKSPKTTTTTVQETSPPVPQTPVKKPSKKAVRKPSKETVVEETISVEVEPNDKSSQLTPVKSKPSPVKDVKIDRQDVVAKQSDDIETPIQPLPVTSEPIQVELSHQHNLPEEGSGPSSPISSPTGSQDFKLASTVHLDQLIRSEIGSPVEPASPFQRFKKENALKVISNALTENAIPGERKSSTLPRRRLSRPDVTPPVAPPWRSAGTAPVTSTNQRTSQFVYPTPAPRTSLSMKETKDEGVSSSGAPPTPTTRERIIPIAVEGRQPAGGASTVSAPPTPGPVQSSSAPSAQPLPRQSVKAPSLSREGSDSGSSVSSLSMKGEAVRKSPREVIIPIAVEGGGYVTPPLRESLAEEGSSAANISSGSRELRGFGLATTRPPRPSMLDTQDSLSSDEDDDNFEILTAENLFSTLLSRVRSLTQRLNEDTGRASGFPSRLFSHESIFDNPSWSRRRGLLGHSRISPGGIMSGDSESLLNRASSRLLEDLPSRITTEDSSLPSRSSRFSSATLPRARITVHVPLVEKE